MKLNKEQRYALAMWLGSKVPKIETDHSVIADFDEFCDEKISEWRIIYNFGLAGKIWNVSNELYVTGYSHGELSKKQYEKQQKTIEEWNKDLILLMDFYA